MAPMLVLFSPAAVTPLRMSVLCKGAVTPLAAASSFATILVLPPQADFQALCYKRMSSLNIVSVSQTDVHADAACWHGHHLACNAASHQLLALATCAGAHILSGNVFEPRALDELFPDWKTKQQAGEEGFADLPIRQQVTKDKFYMLTKGSSIRLPNPPQMKNKGKNYVISLRWV